MNSTIPTDYRAPTQTSPKADPSPATLLTWLTERRCMLLLGFMLCLLALYPLLSGPALIRTGLLDVLASAVLIAAVYAVADRHRHVAIALVLAIPALLGRWFGIEEDDSMVGVVLSLCEIAFFTFTIVLVFAYVLNGRIVVQDRLAGALSVYLLIGVAFAEVYMLLDGVAPGSFTSGRESLGWPEMMYFSFVTLTTLGYGDITPASTQAEALVAIEAVIGVFYLAVLVAWLVSSLKAADEPPAAE